MNAEKTNFFAGRRLSLAIALATALLCAIVMTQRVPLWGAVAWGFRKEPDFLAALYPLLPMAAALLVARALLRAGNEAKRARKIGLLALLCVCSFALNLSVRCGENAGLARLVILTVNPASGGFFEAAYDSQKETDWMRAYPQLMKNHHHVYTHPPGGVALMRFWLARAQPDSALVSTADDFTTLGASTRLTDLATLCSRIWKRPYTASDVAAALWGALSILALSSLLPLCLYGVARPLFGFRAAVFAAALTVLVPSFVLFVPAMDLVYVVLAALSLALAARGIERQNPLWLLLAGIATGIGIGFSFVLVTFAASVVLFLMLRVLAWRQRAIFIACYGAGAILVVAALALLGLDWFAVLHVAREATAQWNVERGLNPALQYVFHLADWLTFLGVPVAILALRVLAAKRGARDNDSVRLSSLSPEAALLIATLAIILITNALSPFAETARIWMPFLVPLLAVAGASLARGKTSLVRVVFLAQAAQLVVFTIFLNVWSL